MRNQKDKPHPSSPTQDKLHPSSLISQDKPHPLLPTQDKPHPSSPATQDKPHPSITPVTQTEKRYVYIYNHL